MSDIAPIVGKDQRLTFNELNNNSSSPVLNRRTIEYGSSGSSSNSDVSDIETTILADEEVKSDQEERDKLPEKTRSSHKLRSMSDGQAGALAKADFVEAFPSLPDSVLKKLGFDDDKERERMSEEELEQKFVALSLAFSIDAATIADRSERQRRYRDQTETNLNTEINKLSEKINQIRFLSVDAERAEHLAGLLTQIDVIVRASSLASISAERFGAVQHEARLAEAVNLMINHVTLLKQQRDSTRKHLQYTKKVLQDTNTTDLISTKKNLISERFLAQRRASIATITQPPEFTKPVATNSSEVKRLTRRTSDISSRVSAFIRSNGPSRLELGVDLDKIKEGIVDENSISDPSECSEDCLHESIIESTDTLPKHQNSTMLSLKKRVSCTFEEFRQRCRIYGINGTFHDFFYIASLLCFLLSVILLGNFFIETHFSEFEFQNRKLLYKYCQDEFKKQRVNS